MCGFAGFVDLRSRRQSREQRRAILEGMGRQLSRRGPDDERFFDDDRLSFVFRRLSIVDLVTGDQPIWNESETLFVAVNGEIYNHRELRSLLRGEHSFRTSSDSEIVLHLYEERGPQALDLLIGMFSMVLWDTAERRLFLARDRLGIKPLYYARAGSLFLFGSEIKALLVHPDCPRGLRWRDIQPSFVDIPRYYAALPTYVEGVEQLPGGSFATYQEGELTTHRYWALEDFFSEEESAKSASGYASEYADLFEDSVRKRLMSDVPVGAFLSGGLDSSALVAAAARSTRDLHCLTVLERSTFLSGDAAAAADLAESLGLSLHQVIFDHRSLAETLDFSLPVFEYFIWLLDSPRFSLDWLLKHELHRFAKTIVPDLKVILLGQGADEFAGGYSKPYATRFPKGGWREYLDGLRDLDQAEGRERSRISQQLSPYVSPQRLSGPGSPFRREMSRRVLILQGYNLWHEDRTGAAQGIEARVPFLDHRLVEFLASIPSARHEELFWDKRMLREMARRFLPRDLTHLSARPKVGFFLSKDVSSIDDLSCSLVKRLFPAFREEYLEDESSLFAKGRLADLFERVDAGGWTSRAAVRMLFSCMSIAVFERLCSRLGHGLEIKGVDPPSPLSEVAPGQAAFERFGGAVDRETPPWETEDQVTLERSVQVVCPIGAVGRKDQVTFIRDGSLERTISLPGEWAFELLRLLSEAKKPLSVGDLTQALGVSPKALRETLDFLFLRGVVVYRAQP